MTANVEHRVKFLDAWRFIAVSMVINGHLLIHSPFGLVFGHAFGPWVHRLAHLGVIFFFFISGYVICTSLLVEYNHTQRVSLPAFYVRRFFRILPPLALFLIACFALEKFGVIDILNSQLLKSALFLCNLQVFFGDCSWYAGHTWSLAYEEQFYLIFPLLFIWLFLFLQKSSSFLMLWVGMVFLSLVLKFTDHDFFGEYLNYMIFLLTGVVAALYKTEILQRLHQTSILHWLIACLSWLLIVYLTPQLYEKYVYVLVYPFLIAYLVLATPVHSSGFRLFFENHFICYLGRISYTVYLWQQLATAKYEYLPLIWYPIMIVAVWVFAHYSFKFFETPLIHYASGLSRRIKERGLNKGSDASGY